MSPQEQMPAPPSPALFPASLVQGFALMLSQGQMGAQALVNQQAQSVQTFSKFIQQSQVNFLNSINTVLLGPVAQAARPPMIPVQAFMQGGEGITPSGFFNDQQSPQAVQQKTQHQVPYYPLTEGQVDFRKGGFTNSPQQMVQFPLEQQPQQQEQQQAPPPPGMRIRTDFF